MTFKVAFYSFWKNYLNFSGKATRSEFWWNVCWILLVGTFFSFISEEGDLLAPVCLFSIITYIPCLALLSRRCYDLQINATVISFIIFFDVIADFFDLLYGAFDELGIGWLAFMIIAADLLLVFIIGVRRSVLNKAN